MCDVDNCLEAFSKEFDDFRVGGVCQNIVGKLITNSLYGRLGVKDHGFKDVISKEPLSNAVSYIKVHNMYVNKVKHKTNAYTNVAIASAITSKARIRLYKAFRSVMVGGGRLLYCDTDSIVAAFTNQDMLDIKTNSGLYFDSKKTDTLIKKALFAGPKTYTIVFKNGVNVTKIKGIPKNSINYEQFESLFLSNSLLKTITQPTLYKKNYLYKIENLTKTINLNNYKKRTFINNYTNTIPLSKVPTINR